MLLFLENHDSFSHLLGDQFVRLGQEIRWVDTYAPHAPLPLTGVAGIVIGPGPGDERTSPNLMTYVAEAIRSGLPILGVCLGMQALGVHFGARLGHALSPIHGKVRPLIPTAGSRLFPERQPEDVVRYHSLILTDLPDSLIAEAASPQGECMALRHSTLPVWAVQYHPEAACTQHGADLLARWLQFAGVGRSPLPLNSSRQPPPQRVAATLSGVLLR